MPTFRRCLLMFLYDLLNHYVKPLSCISNPLLESLISRLKRGLIISFQLCLQVATERVFVLNTVRSKLPFVVTTTDDAKESVKEEIRLRMSLRTI
ncbi:aspartate--tRNA ligase, chloroplastic/mitochondrial-like [Coffea eugenioides]|uniref:aspartate--tRNA ligase, chloroplastic/mitochondrial-like n=1 Tax=Coffea eugenioides TaxID=49369 RepID=UPI000F611768|nr:aspartate--tRNA ligase, chloroplastic/mitochondrial-like [Coffea eugenioides]